MHKRFALIDSAALMDDKQQLSDELISLMSGCAIFVVNRWASVSIASKIKFIFDSVHTRRSELTTKIVVRYWAVNRASVSIRSKINFIFDLVDARRSLQQPIGTTYTLINFSYCFYFTNADKRSAEMNSQRVLMVLLQFVTKKKLGEQSDSCWIPCTSLSWLIISRRPSPPKTMTNNQTLSWNFSSESITCCNNLLSTDTNDDNKFDESEDLERAEVEVGEQDVIDRLVTKPMFQ